MARTEVRGGQILDASVSLTADVTGTLPVGNGGTGATTLTGLLVGNGTGVVTAATAPTGAVVGTTDTQTLTSKTLTAPKIDQINDTTNNKAALAVSAPASGVNFWLLAGSTAGNSPQIYATGSDTNIGFNLYPKGSGAINLGDSNGNTVLLTDSVGAGAVNFVRVRNASTLNAPTIYTAGSDTNIGLNLQSAGTGVVQANGVEVATISGTQTLTNKTLTAPSIGGTPVFTTGIPAANLPNGLTNGNTSRQSQVVVSATSYYIAGSNLNLPATLKAGMAVGTRFRWRVAMDKTAAGTGAFAIEIRRGTAGTTADTADVSQSVGTQTAVVDSMVVDVEMVVTTTGATGAYYWTIIPVHQAASATGFGVATGTTGLFSGTVSSVALNTASLIFGLSFKATTGTPTITVPLVQASAINIS